MCVAESLRNKTCSLIKHNLEHKYYGRLNFGLLFYFDLELKFDMKNNTGKLASGRGVAEKRCCKACLLIM